MTMINSSLLPLYVHSARRLRLSQVTARLRLAARRRTWYRWPWYVSRRYQVAGDALSLASQPLLPYDRDLMARGVRESLRPEAGPRRLADLRANRFHFLNRTVTFGEHIFWNPPEVERLWRYNLHYFDYAWDLVLAEAATSDGEAYGCFRGLVESWVARNPIAQGVGWHAYPTALRIVNWIYAAQAFQGRLAADEAFRPRFLASLFSQCRFLADHLEWDCRGNHLLEDGKSLLTAGLFFSGAEAGGWFRQGAQLVWQALKDQILADGGHYERSPMYHAIVLQDYLEIFALYHARGLQAPAGAEEKLRAMVDWFLALRHPDGEMPLFADAAFGIALGPEELLPVAAVLLRDPRYKWPGQVFSLLARFLLGEPGLESYADLPASEPPVFGASGLFPQSGYFLLGAGQGNTLILDGGDIGPDEAPAHGHCNIFGYELSAAGRRVIVDSGVETYEPGPRRDYYRGTRAHNTLMVDGIEQSEVWAAFRVARRAKLQDVHYAIHPEVAYFEGAHDGFARKVPGLKHRRLVVAVPSAFWLIADYVWGASGKHLLESFVHLHPEVTAPNGAAPVEDPIPLKGQDGSVLMYLVAFGFDECSRVSGDNAALPGWYAPQFGRRLANQVNIWRREGELPHRCGYALVLPGAGLPSLKTHHSEAGDSFTVEIPPRTYHLHHHRQQVRLTQKGVA